MFASVKYLLFAVLASLLLLPAGCRGDEFNEAEPVLVVEGWIEDGEFPTVFVTSSIAVSTEYQSLENLDQYLVRYARVTVSDGDTTVTLVGRADRDIFPPYSYTTSYMRGQAGKSYTLTVDYGGRHVSGVTTIPAPVPVDSFKARQIGPEPTYELKAWFRNDPDKRQYYKVFTRHHSSPDELYYSPFICSYDGADLSNPASVSLYWEKRLGSQDYRPFFLSTDTVDVRFCTMDEASYRYWRDYASTIAFSRNQLIPVTENLPGNLQGGLGYWCGYGASYYTVVMADVVE